MTAGPRTFAVIPAAGHSTRMGRPKLSLPVGGRAVLERVIEAFRAAGVAEVLVVLAPHTADLVPLAENAGADVLVLPEATPDMRTTVEAGLGQVEELHRPEGSDLWLLAPADHPTLNPAVVIALAQAARGHPRHTIFIPTHDGRRGHPALVSWAHVAGIRGLAPDQGLNTYFRQHREQTLELPVATPEVLCDLDTPEDYRQLLGRWAADPRCRPGASE